MAAAIYESFWITHQNGVITFDLSTAHNKVIILKTDEVRKILDTTDTRFEISSFVPQEIGA